MDVELMQTHSEQAANFLKGLANSDRLMILCQLLDGEKNVSELIVATGIAQTSMSQHLSKLKREGLLSYRREHRTLYYFIAHEAVFELMTVMYKHFCSPEKV